MSHLPRDLHEEFPAEAARIHALKVSDQHFAKLAEAYHEVNSAVHRMESGVEAVTDAVLEEAKKLRLQAKDRIAQVLAQA